MEDGLVRARERLLLHPLPPSAYTAMEHLAASLRIAIKPTAYPTLTKKNITVSNKVYQILTILGQENEVVGMSSALASTPSVS